ncbi:MAG TPA: HPF/RaiA family ribosome-associated protein [Bryobacteraceae bacterium]|nr:HPF/RaiA family ribosome-associated protein [Bryobacteraceae bacterium]
MIIAPQITFHNMEPSAEIEAMVLREAARLERYFSRITSCRVMVEGPGRRHGMFRIRIDMGVPGQELVIEHNPTLHGALQAAEAEKKTKAAEPNRQRRDVRLAIHEAFHEARRRLQDYARRMRGQTKQHESTLVGSAEETGVAPLNPPVRQRRGTVS